MYLAHFQNTRKLIKNKLYFYIIEIYINKPIPFTIASKHVILGVTLTIYEPDLHLKNL